MKKIILIFLTLTFSLLAHKINIFSYKESGKIFIEGYFSDGKPCKNSKVIVFDQNGEKIIEGKTDEAGIFSFDIPDKSRIKIVLYADMGHQVETEMQLKEKTPEKQIIKENRKVEQKQAQINIDQEKIRKIVEESIEKEINNLLKEIEKERQKVKIQDIIGGFGYILGIFGIYLYLKGRTSK
ncbi:MAG: hypothetical protein NC827_03840 [Candidatus Omnitrophica bacterium]|nr:hypothetical protein [Candidatus Omnitrophota bacterium]MCM8802425.1 hypothetical protein [Candidatus Omnitrophota bacterium]